MSRRFLLQAIAIIISIALIALLTLTVLGKVSALTFWIIAALALAVVYLFYKKP